MSFISSSRLKPTYENFEVSKHGYEQMDGGEVGDHGGGYGQEGMAESPGSFEEIERPPLRHIDKYCRAECPCLPARFTIAVMACIGFMISFGMRCNMSAAKLKLEHNGVSI